MRKDRCDAGANVISANNGRVANFDAGHIRDGVQWAWWQYADFDAHLPSPWPRIVLTEAERAQNEPRRYCESLDHGYLKSSREESHIYGPDATGRVAGQFRLKLTQYQYQRLAIRL